MDNTVRIVFFTDGNGEVEKVPRLSTEPCPTCRVEKSHALAHDEIEEIGREAARAIGTCVHGCWYDGLVSELVARYPGLIIEQVVKQHPGTVQAVLARCLHRPDATD